MNHEERENQRKKTEETRRLIRVAKDIRMKGAGDIISDALNDAARKYEENPEEMDAALDKSVEGLLGGHGAEMPIEDAEQLSMDMEMAQEIINTAKQTATLVGWKGCLVQLQELQKYNPMLTVLDGEMENIAAKIKRIELGDCKMKSNAFDVEQEGKDDQDEV